MTFPAVHRRRHDPAGGTCALLLEAFAVAELLRKIPLFSTSSLADLQRLWKVATLREFPPGNLLFVRGDPGDCLFLIKQGRVRIFLSNEAGQEWTLSVLGPFQFFGEIALFANCPRTASAQTLERVQAMTLQRDRFQDLLKQHPPMALPILNQMGSRMRDMADRMASAAFLTVEQRVAAKLLELSRLSPDTRTLAMTRHELAVQVGAVRETISKVLNNLRRRGWLELGRGEIRLVDEQALRTYLCPEVFC
ncbi:MAG: Crp/Fnr family transcriptional regulator [Armatimonadetes bacterium]|nr:Crp/Fnr family transcriptional regulator [Armatimonadota bacterium]